MSVIIIWFYKCFCVKSLIDVCSLSTLSARASCWSPENHWCYSQCHEAQLGCCSWSSPQVHDHLQTRGGRPERGKTEVLSSCVSWLILKSLHPMIPGLKKQSENWLCSHSCFGLSGNYEKTTEIINEKKKKKKITIWTLLGWMLND